MRVVEEKEMDGALEKDAAPPFLMWKRSVLLEVVEKTKSPDDWRRSNHMFPLPPASWNHAALAFAKPKVLKLDPTCQNPK
jgi:hypothetical protein